MKPIEKRVFELTKDIVSSNNASLEEVLFEQEGNVQYLRLLIDADGGVNVDMATAISEEVGAIQEIDDMIDGEYFLEVSSLGIERELKNEKDILKNIGQYVHVLLKRKIDNFYEFEGYLKEFNDNMITVEINLKGRIKKFTFKYEDVSLIRLAIKF